MSTYILECMCKCVLACTRVRLLRSLLIVSFYLYFTVCMSIIMKRTWICSGKNKFYYEIGNKINALYPNSLLLCITGYH